MTTVVHLKITGPKGDSGGANQCHGIFDVSSNEGKDLEAWACRYIKPKEFCKLSSKVNAAICWIQREKN